jgi:hypothetical protein
MNDHASQDLPELTVLSESQLQESGCNAAERNFHWEELQKLYENRDGMAWT